MIALIVVIAWLCFYILKMHKDVRELQENNDNMIEILKVILEDNAATVVLEEPNSKN